MVARRLKQLETAARDAGAILEAMDEGYRDSHDVAAVQLVVAEIRDCRDIFPEGQERAELILIRHALRRLSLHSHRAQSALKAMGGKKGQRGLSWYESFFEVLLQAARALGIPLTTAGDRSKNPHETPLTVLAYALERGLHRRHKPKPSLPVPSASRKLSKLGTADEGIAKKQNEFPRVTRRGWEAHVSEHSNPAGARSKTKTMQKAEALLTTAEVAERLRVSTSFLAKARVTGLGPTFIKVGRSCRYRVSDLENYERSRARSSTSQQ